MKQIKRRIAFGVLLLASMVVAATGPIYRVGPRAGGSLLINSDGSITVTNPAGKATSFSGAVVLGNFSVAGLPAGASGKFVYVTDGASASDCTVGLGTTRVLCGYNGSAWVAIGGTSIAPLVIESANAVGQYNGTTPQNFMVYGTRTDASNYERLNFGNNAGNHELRYQSAGTGAARAFVIRNTNGGLFLQSDTSFVTIGSVGGITIGDTVAGGDIALAKGSRTEWGLRNAVSAPYNFQGLAANKFCWVPGTTFTAGPDTCLSRNAAAVIRATDGSTGGAAIAAGAASGQPTCDVTNRGAMWPAFAGAGASDTFQVCMKAAADTYAWRTVFTAP